MADLSINIQNVKPNGCVVDKTHFAAAATPAGKSVFLNTAVSPNTWVQANAVSLTLCPAGAQFGITLNQSLAANAPIDVATAGSPTPGANPMGAEATDYYVSPNNTGGICPGGDMGDGDLVVFLGFSDGSGNLLMPPNGAWNTGLTCEVSGI